MSTSAVESCGTCRANRGEIPAPGGVIYQDAHWRLEHIFEPIPLAGWLVLKPLRHVESIAGLHSDEAATLGPLLQRIVDALTATVQLARVYVCLFAEAEGFSHIHFHLIPRAPDLPDDLRGPRIFALMGQAQSEARSLADPNHATAIAGEVRERLHAPDHEPF